MTKPGDGDQDEVLTVNEFCETYKIARSTFYDWKAKGRAPRTKKLPNGDLRITRADASTWWDGL
ncbi:helix-turn-helix domain-containing protein [Kineosporia rhizophila]|uniref:helix-turn-helix transcriptional regulator n=1 Tax=Kineosporia rhizophila TaxID=84633 RepID=UPI000AC74EFA|nr:helix-turn-helix domain-containing protein [Kineosporia rhizophila]MCE0536618.1 helix-turn-helix domain-containing protein [Kineosporia rhizophila]